MEVVSGCVEMCGDPGDEGVIKTMLSHTMRSHAGRDRRQQKQQMAAIGSPPFFKRGLCLIMTVKCMRAM